MFNFPCSVNQGELVTPSPRFPDSRGRARRVGDKSPLCRKWTRNGACELDRDFNISTVSSFQPVQNVDMWDFMQKSCMKSCGWAPKGKEEK